MNITSLERTGQRVRLFLDGKPALTLSLDLAMTAGLRVGDAIDQAALADLRQQETRYRAWQAALRLLSYRPRSEAEIRQRLARRGVPQDIVEATVRWLKQQDLLDDTAFSRFWVETRNELGSRRLERELMQKGVSRETSREAVSGHNDAGAALASAQRRLAVLRTLDYATFYRRLGGYLARRGFTYDVIRQVVAVCWQQRQA